MTHYQLLIKFPSRERPAKFFEYLLNLLGKLEDRENYLVICSFDLNDTTMNNPGTIARLEALKTEWHIEWHFGHSKNKVAAINRDMPRSGWDILFSCSDDMWCEKQGWDNELRRQFEAHYPDTDGFFHFWDGDGSTRNTGRGLCTYSIMGNRYYNRFRYIYHPHYNSLWCDNEATEVAQMLCKYTYVDEVLFRHVHFSNNPSLTPDALMQKTQAFFNRDRETFENRKRKNFRY